MTRGYVGMEREWLIGQQLNKLAPEGSEDVPGVCEKSWQMWIQGARA